MRRFLAALVVIGAGAVPASGVGPPLHVATISGGAVSVTCDTSSYPAATYPCELYVEARPEPSECVEVTTTNRPFGTCRLTVRGPLFARPASSPTGTCEIWSVDSWGFDDDTLRIAFDSDVDPTFHAEVGASSTPLDVQRATVGFGALSHATDYTMSIVPSWAGVALPDVAPGALVVQVRFPDITWDCRSTSGGSPASDAEGGFGAYGELAFIRTA